MKFHIGGLRVIIDLTQLLNGNGFTLKAFGEIRPYMELTLEVAYVPVSKMPLSISLIIENEGE